MIVGALFVDYDGTIAPLGVPRSESRIFRRVEAELRRIAGVVPVCIVTAKDFGFVYPRCRFAAGWACASGLDVRLADGRLFGAAPLRNLERVVAASRELEKSGAIVELKRGASEALLAVDVDWSAVPDLGPRILRQLRDFSREGYETFIDRRSSFADVYAARPDKGKATELLINVLEIKSEVMFIGDSTLDNGAFQGADVAVGVAHGQPLHELECDYIVEKPRMAEFLGSLYDRRMDFTPSIPSVRRKEEVKE